MGGLTTEGIYCRRLTHLCHLHKSIEEVKVLTATIVFLGLLEDLLEDLKKKKHFAFSMLNSMTFPEQNRLLLKSVLFKQKKKTFISNLLSSVVLCQLFTAEWLV